MASASSRVIGSARSDTSRSVSTWMPPRPNISTGPNTGSRCTPAMHSTPPVSMRATSAPSSRASGRAVSARSRVRSKAARACAAPRSPSATPPTSDLCGMSALTIFTTTASPSASAADAASSALRTTRCATTGTPASASSASASGSDIVPGASVKGASIGADAAATAAAGFSPASAAIVRMPSDGSANTRQRMASSSARRCGVSSVLTASSVSGYASRSELTNERSTGQNASDAPAAARKPIHEAKPWSSSITRAVRSISVMSLVTWPVMSTGLRGAAKGTQRRSVSCAASLSGRASRPWAEASSAISAPTPPESVNRPIERSRGRPATAALWARSKNSVRLRARSTPYWRNTASYTASSPASEAVCEAAASAPSAVRPTLTITTGLPWACARASAARSRGPSRQPSM
ncbi:hypothetical protein FQZ97_797930 [compost metagenome]